MLELDNHLYPDFGYINGYISLAFLPGEFHGQRNLAGYSSWVTKSRTQLSD